MAKARIAYRVGGARLAEQPLFPYQLSRPRRNTARLTTPRAAFASGVSAPLSAGTSCAGSPSQYSTLHSSVAHEGQPADSHDFLRIKLPKPRRFLKAMAAESVVGWVLGTPHPLRRNNKQTVAARRTPGEWDLVRRASVGRGKERLNLARLRAKSEAVRRPASTVLPMLVLMRAHGHLYKVAAPQPRSVETSTAAYYVWQAAFFTVMSTCQRRLECCARMGTRRHDLEPR